MANRAFFNIAGIGFDARIARLFNERGAGRRGTLPYVLIGLREGCRYAGATYSVELDGERRRVHALLIAFANGREYGSGASIAPLAELDDGVLDGVIVEYAVLGRSPPGYGYRASRTQRFDEARDACRH
jgi:diacylglycerol kinase family enzyme